MPYWLSTYSVRLWLAAAVLLAISSSISPRLAADTGLTEPLQSTCAGFDAAGHRMPGVPVSARSVNAPDQMDKPYLLLISLDGFRWDLTAIHPTPAIDSLAAKGVKSEALLPVFPTLTFPNHYSLATGLYPSSHGIVANDFFDRRTQERYYSKDKSIGKNGNWYGGEPIWLTAARQGLVSASQFFVGTEADIQGMTPAYCFAFDQSLSGQQRVEQVLEWMSLPAERRPHVLLTYFQDVDSAAHTKGLDSPEFAEAVGAVDGYIATLLAGIEALPIRDQVYVVLVSDHGVGSYAEDRPVFIVDAHVQLPKGHTVNGGNYVFHWLNEPDPQRAGEIRDQVNRLWDCGNAYLSGDLPEAWQVKPGPRQPDLYLLADPGCGVLSTETLSRHMQPGDHGWSPEMSEMRGIFIAAGPGIVPGQVIPPVKTIDVYPFLTDLLGLEIKTAIDGKAGSIREHLQAPNQ